MVVDGNPYSRSMLRSILDHDPQINYLGQPETEEEVLAILEEQPRTLLFMDVQMPGLDCFRFLLELDYSMWPTVILLAPDTRRVMDAFRLHVFGYLLRPLSQALVHSNLQAAKIHFEYFQLRNAHHTLRAGGSASPSERLVIKSRGRFIFLRSEEIDWIEAMGNYVRIHAGPMSYIERKTMTSFETHLDPARFVRIHKSAIVNIDKIRELKVWPTGEYAVLMRNGKELTLTRHYRDRLSGLLGRQVYVETPSNETLLPQEMPLGG
jgi:two-component system LytT family response regulator